MRRYNAPSNGYEAPVRHATFDDSGGKQDGAYIYARFVAPKSYWDRFNNSWDDALAKCRLVYLHTSEFIHSIPIIGTSPRTDEDAYVILAPFVEAIESQIVRGEGYAVIRITTSDAWSGLTKEQKAVVRQPQINCFESAIGLACTSLMGKMSEMEPLAVQVDESNNIATLAGAHNTLKKYPLLKNSRGATFFADDKKLRSVQAADLLAHLVLRQWRIKDAGVGSPASSADQSRSTRTIKPSHPVS